MAPGIKEPRRACTPPPADLFEEGRRLASQRDDLIAQGVDPAELAVPVYQPAPPAQAEAVTVSTSGRPSNERDGACICDYNPETTDGPQEDCPFHGRPYSYWVERVDELSARLVAVEAKCTEWDLLTKGESPTTRAIRDALSPQRS